MSLRELRDDPDVLGLLSVVIDRLETAQQVTNECKDFPLILEAQGEIKTLKWLLEQFEE